MYRIISFWISASILITGLSVSLLGQQKAFSLKEAQVFAVKNSLETQNSDIDIGIAKSQVKEFKAIGLPQVNGSVGYSYNLKIATQLLPDFISPAVYGVLFQEELLQPREVASDQFFPTQFGTKHNLSADLEATQLLFSGSYLLGLKAANIFVELSEKRKTLTEVDVRDRVAKAYLAVLVTDENLKIVDKNISNLNTLAFELSEMNKAGFIEEIEVDRVTLSLANLNTQKQNLERQQELATELLKFQMGFTNESIILTDSLEQFTAELTVPDGQNATKNRIEYKIMEDRQRLNEMDIRQMKSRYYPSLVAFGSYGQAYQANNYNIFKNEWFPSAAIGLRLNVPIFDGFEKKAGIQKRKLEQEQLALGKELLKRSIHLEIEQTGTAFNNALGQLNNQKSNLKLAEKIYNVAVIKYREGLGSSLEITDAESKMYETQALYIQSLYDLIIAKTSLDRAMAQ